MRSRWIVGLILLCWSGAVRAADSSDPIAIGDAAEDVIVLNGINPVRLTPAQIEQLLPHLRGAQERLREAEAADARSFAGLHKMLLDARSRLLAGDATASSAEQQIALNRQSAAQRQAQVRRDLATSLRRQLAVTLTPTQQAQMVTRGQQLLAAERTTLFQQRAVSLPAGPGGGPGRGAGGAPGGFQSRMLDRLREAPQEQFDLMAQRMALRAGEPGTPAYNESLNFLNRVRRMPSGDYQRQRDLLAQEFMQSRLQAQQNAEAAMDRFIDRYLLSPRIVTLLEEKIKR